VLHFNKSAAQQPGGEQRINHQKENDIGTTYRLAEEEHRHTDGISQCEETFSKEHDIKY
jgi:hypothetical protein